MQTCCLIDVLKQGQVEDAYSEFQCAGSSGCLHGAPPDHAAQLIRICFSCSLQNMLYCSLANCSV